MARGNERRKPAGCQLAGAALALVIINLLPTGWPPSGSGWASSTMLVGAVSVQKLNVPDLVVIDQLNLVQQQQQARSSDAHKQPLVSGGGPEQPEAASLINSQDQQQQFTFECLVGFDKRRDKNLIVKWHHDERNEPIYQWIPELNKRSVAPQYRAYIVPIVGSTTTTTTTTGVPSGPDTGNSTNQVLEASFKLVRPSKELGGKYTCSAISSQNDDSKSKKMIVYTPPRSFKFNASRTSIAAGPPAASQRDRLIQLVQPANNQQFSSAPNTKQLPLAYRMRGLDNYPSQLPQQASPTNFVTTLSPQMYSTIDYVNVNQQRFQQWSPASPLLTTSNTLPSQQQASFGQAQTISIDSLLRQRSNSQMSPSSAGNFNKLAANGNPTGRQHNGVKLICDIDQVFPVPEVSIYRLARADGSHPDKLAKLDTRIDRDLLTGLYHVQVTSLLDDDELQMKYGINEPVYFECLIALTNLELSKYADNKRSIIYRPGSLLANSLQSSEEIKFDPYGNGAGGGSQTTCKASMICAVWLAMAIILLERSHVWSADYTGRRRRD